MSAEPLVAWAAPRLSQLLPLDEESLAQIVEYSTSLSKEACAEHLKNLLGDSPAALEFITSFNTRRDAQRRAGDSTSKNASLGPKKGKKTKAPIHNAGPVRRPDNYGNVTGGYMKADRDEDYITAASSRSKQYPGMSLSAEPAALQVPRDPSPYESPASSRTQSPAPKSTTKAPPSASGPMVSDLLPNVKSKAAKVSRQSDSRAGSPSKGSGSVTTNNIGDLTSAIASLELSTNPTVGKGRQKCTCYATIHPLFTPVPNCLSCGKIICSLEGLQPCSFCGTPLLSNDEIQSMIRELRAERGQEKMRAHNDSVHHDGVPGSGSGSGPSNQLDAAKAHRDKLLQFQAQNARRTRVVDEAADFDTPNPASTIWMSPAQRALALKKQQRILREMEDKARPEWEKKKTVMSLDIKGGRVRKVYQSAPVDEPSQPTDDVEAEEEALAEEGQPSSGQAFSHNPLLAAGGLLRPVWKSPEGKEVRTHRETKQPWRRVQDDRDDNEQWILDGGLHGYNT